MTPELIYLAAPYRGKTGRRVEIVRNVSDAVDRAADIVAAGHYVLCPHLSYYLDSRMAYSQFCQPDSYWLEATMEMMRRCDRVVFVPGESQGVLAEIEEALRLLIPVQDFDSFMAGGAECATPS